MKTLLKKLALVLALATFAGLPIFAQQVNVLTTGTGGVGTLMVGVGQAGAARLSNARITLSNAQVLALNSTAVSVIGAPGAGYVVDVLDGMLIFNYTAAYATLTGDLRLWYTDRVTGPAASNVIETTGFLDASADKIIAFSGTPDDTLPTANTAVKIESNSNVAFTSGNASNQVYVDVTYVIRQTGL